MKKTYLKILEVAIFVLLFIAIFITKKFWLLELYIIWFGVMGFRHMENMRKEFSSNIPSNILIAAPLKTEIYNLLFFSIGIIFLGIVLFLLIYYKQPDFYEHGFAVIGLVFFIGEIISYIHQLVHPRTVYFTDKNIYFYEREIITIPYENIKSVELHNNMILIREDGMKTTLEFQKDMPFSTFKDIKYHLIQAAPNYGYELTKHQLT